MRSSLSILLGLAFLAVVPGCLHPCCDVRRSRCDTCMPDACGDSETVMCAPRGPDAECHGFKPTTWQPWPCDEGYGAAGAYQPPIFSPTPAESEPIPDPPPAPQARKQPRVHKTKVIRQVSPQPRPVRQAERKKPQTKPSAVAQHEPDGGVVEQAGAVEHAEAEYVEPQRDSAQYDPFDEFLPSYQSGPLGNSHGKAPIRFDAAVQPASFVAPAVARAPVVEAPAAVPTFESRKSSRATSTRSQGADWDGEDAPPRLPPSAVRTLAPTEPEDESDDPAPSYRGR